MLKIIELHYYILKVWMVKPMAACKIIIMPPLVYHCEHLFLRVFQWDNYLVLCPLIPHAAGGTCNNAFRLKNFSHYFYINTAVKIDAIKACHNHEVIYNHNKSFKFTFISY